MQEKKETNAMQIAQPRKGLHGWLFYDIMDLKELKT